MEQADAKIFSKGTYYYSSENKNIYTYINQNKKRRFHSNLILRRNESKCEHCTDCRVSSIDCAINCSRCGGETGGSTSSTAHTTATDLTNPDGLEECYEKVYHAK